MDQKHFVFVYYCLYCWGSSVWALYIFMNKKKKINELKKGFFFSWTYIWIYLQITMASYSLAEPKKFIKMNWKIKKKSVTIICLQILYNNCNSYFFYLYIFHIFEFHIFFSLGSKKLHVDVFDVWRLDRCLYFFQQA